jgi:hypothetical protein
MPDTRFTDGHQRATRSATGSCKHLIAVYRAINFTPFAVQHVAIYPAVADIVAGIACDKKSTDF